ncbi:uncharacterized protein LOC141851730 [Brevipalpus obovatus]|uniref:uncharacterized protein LOC141851730 n=1 Tax=Brevipalpus obovatus TaxID=246614 RepID=UPI003D9F7D03
METLTYGWLSNCAIAPSVAAICVWILFMLNSYRNEWRNVDIFIVVIVIQEILSSLGIFAYSVINILRSRSETSCNIVLWALITVRIFQLSTISSLAVDRALILKWPYKYRFSVRQNQIMYHIVVLAIMSSLVGVAGVFARLPIDELIRSSSPSSPSSHLHHHHSSPSPSLSSSTTTASPSASTLLYNVTRSLNSVNSTPLINVTPISSLSSSPSASSPLPLVSTGSVASSVITTSPGLLMTSQHHLCTLNPLSWDIRFNLFFTCLCALLTLITLFAFVYIECNRSSDRRSIKSRMMPNSRISSYGDLAIDSLGSTEAITKNSSSTSTSTSAMANVGSAGGAGAGGGVGGLGGGGGTCSNINSPIITATTSANHSGTSSLQRFSSFSYTKDDVGGGGGGGCGGGGKQTILSHLRASDLRWAAIVAITSLCYAINQGPSLIFMFVGMIVPHFWTTLHDNVITWFALIEGFLLPFSLYLTDDSFREAVRMAFRRRSSLHDINGGVSCKSIYKSAMGNGGGMLGKPPPGLPFHYNDFIVIDKPYLGLGGKSSDKGPKRTSSSLNILSSSNGRIYHGGSMNRSNCKLMDMMMMDSGAGGRDDGTINHYKNGGHYVSPKKSLLSRNNSQLSYMLPHSKKSSSSPFFTDYHHNNHGGIHHQPSPLGGGGSSPFHLSTLLSNFRTSEEPNRKNNKIPWTCPTSGDSNWRLLSSSTEKQLNCVHQHPLQRGPANHHQQSPPHGQSCLSGTESQDDEHIYATLKIRSSDDEHGVSNWDEKSGCNNMKATGNGISRSSGNSNNNGNSGNDSVKKININDKEDDNSVSGVSFTTNANDDFEFHDTRNQPDSNVGVKSLSTSKVRQSSLGMALKEDVESGDSSSSAGDMSILSSDSCLSSDSECDVDQKMGKKWTNSNINVDQMNRKHLSNHMMIPMPGPLRSRNRFSSSQALCPENKRRGWQFFSTSDIHLLDSKSSDINQLFNYHHHHQQQQQQHPHHNHHNHSSNGGKDFVSGMPSGPSIGRPFPNGFGGGGLYPHCGGGGNGISGISYRRTMSETNLSPLGQAAMGANGGGGGSMMNGPNCGPFFGRDKAIYVPIRSMNGPHGMAVPSPNNRFNNSNINNSNNNHYPTNESHHTNDTFTSNSTNSSGLGENKFGPMLFGDRRLNRISSFSKNRPRIRAQKYQIHRRAARRQESAKEMSTNNMDYRRHCIGSRLSLAHDLNPKELATFVSVKSMPDLTVGGYFPIYAPLKK